MVLLDNAINIIVVYRCLGARVRGQTVEISSNCCDNVNVHSAITKSIVFWFGLAPQIFWTTCLFRFYYLRILIRYFIRYTIFQFHVMQFATNSNFQLLESSAATPPENSRLFKRTSRFSLETTSRGTASLGVARKTRDMHLNGPGSQVIK